MATRGFDVFHFICGCLQVKDALFLCPVHTVTIPQQLRREGEKPPRSPRS